MKGKWVFDLAARTLDGRIPVSEAVSFASARLRPKPLDLRLGGVTFPSAGHTTWSVLADIFLGRVYNPPGFEIQPGWVVVDIGAHRGVFSAYAITHGASKVFAFEPHPENFARFQQLIAQHGWQQVHARQIALAGESGAAHLQKGPTTTTGSTLNVSAGETQAVEVQALSLEDALDGIGQIDLLKMDCEGAEFDILQAAPAPLLERVRRLTLEYHAKADSAALGDLSGLLGTHFDRVLIEPLQGKPLGYIYADR